jgi:DNA polymerase I-like protein with 3'-5' exonuclease and polymerase domains
MTLIAGHTLDVREGTQAIYNGFDCALTFQIDEVRQQVHQNDTLIYDFERAMQGPALEMMLRGFRVDVNERERAIIATQARRNDYKYVLSRILSAIPGPWTEKLVGSPKQLQTLFYTTMKLPEIAKHYGGERKLPMDRETLEKLQQTNKWADVLINDILWTRDLNKTLQVLETEIRVGEPQAPGDINWRWHCSYNIGGTSTGRWSSSKSPFGDGNNFQNVTEELRRVFIPDPGMKLYGIDKAQSEAHDVGWLCGLVFGDWSYLDACESGDLHTNVTRLLYPEWDWTDNPRLNRQLAERRFYRLFTFRDASKRLSHATNYYGKPREISRQTRIPLFLVEEFQRRYFAAFPCIQMMHTWVAEQLAKYRYLVNSYGRRRDFFEHPKSDETLKGAIAYLFQSATGDALNLGLYRLWKKMGRRIQILSQLHDAVYFQAPIPANDNDEQAMLREAVDCIEISQHHRASGRTMRIPGEVVGGFNWAHRFRLLPDGSQEDWNPKGLTGIKVAA